MPSTRGSLRGVRRGDRSSRSRKASAPAQKVRPAKCRGVELLEALAVPDPPAWPRTEAPSPDRASPMATAHRHRSRGAVPPRPDPQRRNSNRRDGAERTVDPARSPVRVQEPVRGHPRALLGRLRGCRRSLHPREPDADCDLQQDGRRAARRVRRAEEMMARAVPPPRPTCAAAARVRIGRSDRRLSRRKSHSQSSASATAPARPVIDN